MPGFRRETWRMAIGRPAIAREGAVLKPVGVVLRSFHILRIIDGVFTESRARNKMNIPLSILRIWNYLRTTLTGLRTATLLMF